MRTRHIYFGLAAICILAASCVKQGETAPNESRKVYLESWMHVNHPGIQPTGLGIYILEDTPGTGAEWTPGSRFVFVDYTVRSLDGSISSTNSEKLSRQLGTYNKAASYEPVTWTLGEGYSYAGVDEILSGMKVGGTRTAIIPSWLLTQKRYPSADKYLDVEVDASPAVYTITLRDMTADLKKYSTDRLHEYVRTNLDSALDSTYYNNEDGDRIGFYFQSTKQPRPDSTFKSGDIGYLYYVGRRLDGQVFDTNIADTAKVYGIYNSSNSYTPAKVTFDDNYTDIKFAGSTPITGFQAAMFRMHAFEEATTVFYYGLGYGGTTQPLIPGYSSLRFDLILVENPDK